MRTDRLLKTADMLENLPATLAGLELKHCTFNMELFGCVRRYLYDDVRNPDWDNFPDDDKPITVPHCGTTACALGWAGLVVPEFQADGLKTDLRTGNVTFGEDADFHAAAAFYEIELSDAYYLFGGTVHTDPVAEDTVGMARFIRDYVTKQEAARV